MKKYTTFLLVLIITSSSFSQIKHSDHYYKRKALFEKAPDTKDEIIFLGNSITEGGNWKELFPEYNAINRGISGDVTDGILFRLDEVLSSQPKKIFLLIGVNDLARGKSVAYIFSNIDQIIKKIRKESPYTLLYVQSVLPINPTVGDRFSGHKNKKEEIIELNKMLKRLGKGKQFVFINLHKKFKKAKGYLNSNLTDDGLHLNAKGYQFWKKTIYKYVKS